MKAELGGLGKKERFQLGQIMKARLPIITPQNAAKTLKISKERAAWLLANWAQKGWLSRIKHGVYIPVPLQTENPEVMADEPWVIAKSLFSPCYIGGWSAAEHWGFTEQIFNSVMVLTSRRFNKIEKNLRGAKFTLKLVKSERLFGIKSVWLEQHKVDVSDPTKTIVDAFNDPAIVGGIRMALDILNRYMTSEHKDLKLLFDYAVRMKNTAIFKRLGFVFEKTFPQEAEWIEKFRSKLKSGYSQLDPSVPGKVLITTWGLWIPLKWKKGDLHD